MPTHGDAVHVVEDLVLAAHRPAEGVRARADAGVDGPHRRDDDVMVVHGQMARLVAGAHEVEHRRVRRDVEIHVHLRAALVRVRRHRVPVGAGLQLREAHHELAAVALAGEDELVDRAHVAVLHRAEVAVVRVLEPDELRGIFPVRRIRREVERGRLLRAL